MNNSEGDLRVVGVGAMGRMRHGAGPEDRLPSQRRSREGGEEAEESVDRVGGAARVAPPRAAPRRTRPQLRGQVAAGGTHGG